MEINNKTINKQTTTTTDLENQDYLDMFFLQSKKER